MITCERALKPGDVLELAQSIDWWIPGSNKRCKIHVGQKVIVRCTRPPIVEVTIGGSTIQVNVTLEQLRPPTRADHAEAA